MRSVADYVTVPREMVKVLTLDAIGLMTYLRMIRRGHDAIVEIKMGELASRHGISVYTLMHIIEELEEAGYMSGHIASNGELRWSMYSKPLPENKRTTTIQELVREMEPIEKSDSGYNRG